MKPTWFDIPLLETDFQALADQQSKSESEAGETNLTTMPLHKMWKDDMLWMHFLLSKRRFIGRVDLVDTSADITSGVDAALHPLVKWWFATIDE